MITFAVIGHNEAETLVGAVEQALAVAVEGDKVVFVDSASTDASVEVARAAGIEVWEAPIGKGRAMAHAVDRASTDWILFLDADRLDSERNVPEVIASAVRANPSLVMVVGEDVDPYQRVIQSNTVGIYQPLMRALYPGNSDVFGSKPLSGARAVRRDLLLPVEALPSDFGIEAYINCLAAQEDRDRVEVVPVGWFRHPFKYKPFMGREIANGVLSAAERHGIITAADRPAWNAWVERVRVVVASYHGDEAEMDAFVERLQVASSAAMPPLAADSRVA